MKKLVILVMAMFFMSHASAQVDTVVIITNGDVRTIPNLKGLKELLYDLGANLEQLSDSIDWESFERDMERWSESMERWSRRMAKAAPRPLPNPIEEPERRSLLFNPHWCGVDAGLNMLFTPSLTSDMGWNYTAFELKPLKSWNFNFNIADVGIAFNRRHTVGLYTGVGLGWNNYSLNNPVRLRKGDERLETDWIDEGAEGRVRKSKLGVLYIQMPIMLEVRPTRGFFVAAGVTGGLRVDTWTKIRFYDGYVEKRHSDYYVNPFKLDAVLRTGGNHIGFYASYNLLPLFREGRGPKARTFNVGFSLIF